MAFWNKSEYEREKRNFIKNRLHARAVITHATIIFTVTWLAGWFFSYMLLNFGMPSMPMRYGISFALAYLVFLGCVRVWAGMMASERGGQWDPGGVDAPFVGDGEGCLVVLGIMIMGVIVAGAFALTGGLPLLLEVAFEVVFSGVMIRRLTYIETVGNWVQTLIRNTWVHASAVLCILVGIALWLQIQVPDAKTFAQAANRMIER